MSRAPSPPASLSPTLAPTVAIMQTPPSTEALGTYPSLPPSPPSSHPPDPDAQDQQPRSSQSEPPPPDSVPVPPLPPPITTAPTPPAKPQYAITLLLVSGRRRTLHFDTETNIGSMKDVIWNTWPADWSDEQPPSASFLRILYLGRILTDDTVLSSLNLPVLPQHSQPQQSQQRSSTGDPDAQNDSLRNHPLSSSDDGHPIATVFHVSVRSFAPAGEEDDLNKSKKGRRRRMLSGNGANGGNGGTTAGGVSGDTNPGAPQTESRGCCGCIIC